MNIQVFSQNLLKEDFHCHRVASYNAKLLSLLHVSHKKQGKWSVLQEINPVRILTQYSAYNNYTTELHTHQCSCSSKEQMTNPSDSTVWHQKVELELLYNILKWQVTSEQSAGNARTWIENVANHHDYQNRKLKSCAVTLQLKHHYIYSSNTYEVSQLWCTLQSEH